MMGKKNPLIELIFNSEWDKALKCLHSDGSHARKWNVAQSFTRDLRPTEILPIHQACAKNDVQVKFLESLIFAYPESLQMRESGALRTSLHIAFRARAPDEVISFLMKECPEAISTQDSMGRIPLHYAFSNHASPTIINKLIIAFPDSVRAPDNMLWTPLHVASSLYNSVEIFETMLEFCPEAVMMVTKKGTTIIDIAKSNPSKSKAFILDRLIKEQKKFHKMPVFQNFRDAEKRHEKHEQISSSCFRRSTNKMWGTRKRVRSNSVRRVV